MTEDGRWTLPEEEEEKMVHLVPNDMLQCHRCYLQGKARQGKYL
jgi:hypothetical protein